MSREARQEDLNNLKPILATARQEIKKVDLKSISTDELWALHEEITSILSAKMRAKKAKLEKRLNKLEGKPLDRTRQYRPYRIVHPKFRNAEPPHQTWSGRGKQPHWMRDLLARGQSMEDVRITSG